MHEFFFIQFCLARIFFLYFARPPPISFLMVRPLERIVFYELSTRLLFHIAQSVISDDPIKKYVTCDMTCQLLIGCYKFKRTAKFKDNSPNLNKILSI